MRALVMNAGSSSLKYQVIDTNSRECIFKGQVERIGIDGLTHEDALKVLTTELAAAGIALESIDVVGHRVVHGGSTFLSSVKLDDAAIAGIEQLIPLAPLHNPAHVTVIKAMMKVLSNIPHVAVFDTAFHSTMPAEAYTYALNHDVAKQYGVRRYGFHGSSHKYVTSETAKFLGKKPAETSLIICHIGNGASVTAVQHGRSVDTSMGMTPLEGLMMGTRSGDIDAGVLFHLAREAKFSIDQLDDLVNKKSGLLGLAGIADMREVHERALAGDSAALLARSVYAYRIRKYIGSYFAVLPELDAVVFTAGVGENDPDLREQVMAPLRHMGMHLSIDKNAAISRSAREISEEGSPTRIVVMPTNEELEIALESANIVGGHHE